MLKHYIGETIKVYDGDLIGWTTATLIKKTMEIKGLEQWTMRTKEGYELKRFINLVEVKKKCLD